MSTDSDTITPQGVQSPTPADLLDAICRENKMSQAELARWLSERLVLPISRATMHNWVSGKFRPGIRIMATVAAAYSDDDPRARLARNIMELSAAPNPAAGGDDDQQDPEISQYVSSSQAGCHCPA